MNIRYFIAPALAVTLMALASTAALADDPTVDSTPFVVTHSRSEVKAEVRQARHAHQLLAAGELAGSAASNEPAPLLARATVKAEVLAARAHGELLPAGELAVATASQPRRLLAVTTLAAAR
ncbi:hypothetical protein [Aquabacterium sp.]|uniref:hypothetical protein n=1 Tax=Aquabacterium sp. TaxID=1872578 RepID=UPI0037852A0F